MFQNTEITLDVFRKCGFKININKFSIKLGKENSMEGISGNFLKYFFGTGEFHIARLIELQFILRNMGAFTTYRINSRLKGLLPGKGKVINIFFYLHIDIFNMIRFMSVRLIQLKSQFIA